MVAVARNIRFRLRFVLRSGHGLTVLYHSYSEAKAAYDHVLERPDTERAFLEKVDYGFDAALKETWKER